MVERVVVKSDEVKDGRTNPVLFDIELLWILMMGFLIHVCKVRCRWITKGWERGFDIIPYLKM